MHYVNRELGRQFGFEPLRRLSLRDAVIGFVPQALETWDYSQPGTGEVAVFVDDEDGTIQFTILKSHGDTHKQHKGVSWLFSTNQRKELVKIAREMLYGPRALQVEDALHPTE